MPAAVMAVPARVSGRGPSLVTRTEEIPAESTMNRLTGKKAKPDFSGL